eukprot:s176_g8.t1
MFAVGFGAVPMQCMCLVQFAAKFNGHRGQRCQMDKASKQAEVVKGREVRLLPFRALTIEQIRACWGRRFPWQRLESGWNAPGRSVINSSHVR